MRLCAVNQFYWPDMAATSQLLTDLCEHFAQLGHDVHVVCARTRYDGGSADLVDTELHHGVRIHRVWTPEMGGRQSLRARAAEYASFNAASLAKLLTLPRMDVVLALTTPPMVATVGYTIKKLRGSKLICWVQDLYPDVAVALGALNPEGPVARGAARLTRRVLRRADAVVVLGDAMKARVIAAGARGNSVQVIHNWADGGAIHPRPTSSNPLRAAWNIGGRFCVMYSGNLGMAHDFQTLENAFIRIGRDDDVSCQILGDGVRKEPLKKVANERGLTSLQFRPLVPRDQLCESLTAADVHLISLHEKLSGMVVPSKLYGVMAAGRPSIYVGPKDSDVWRILDDTGAGICVRNGDDRGVVEALGELKVNASRRQQMGRAARDAFLRRFDKGHALHVWESVLTSTAQGQEPASHGLGFTR